MNDQHVTFSMPNERIFFAIARRSILPGLVCSLTLSACGGQTETPPRTSEVPSKVPTTFVASVADAGLDAEISDAAAMSIDPDAAAPVVQQDKPASACPDDMIYVDTTYCPEVDLHCLNSSYNTANHIVICNEFAKEPQKCVSGLRRQRYCIDKYEYPNKAGAHPPVMVDWYDALGMCQERGKRLCWESEWVAACEGPEKKPFPYGYKRDPQTCNIDNPWLQPTLDKIYSKDKTIQEPELFRLDQSVWSGERPGCKSDFGVYDQTGNVDEWVNAEKNYKKSKWAGLKGGAWGHVRNACRPMTVSHEPSFTYYFVSFRCCSDAAPDAAADQDPKMWKPPPQPDPKKPSALSKGYTPPTRGPHQPPAQQP